MWRHVYVSSIGSGALTNELSLYPKPPTECSRWFDGHGNQEGQVRKEPVKSKLFFRFLQTGVKWLVIRN